MASFNLDEHETIRKLFNSTTSLLVLNISILILGLILIFFNEIPRAIGTSLIAIVNST